MIPKKIQWQHVKTSRSSNYKRNWCAGIKIFLFVSTQISELNVSGWHALHDFLKRDKSSPVKCNQESAQCEQHYLRNTRFATPGKSNYSIPTWDIQRKLAIMTRATCTHKKSRSVGQGNRQSTEVCRANRGN